MRSALLRNVSLCRLSPLLFQYTRFQCTQKLLSPTTPIYSIPKPRCNNAILAFATCRNYRFFSSDSESSDQNPKPAHDITSTHPESKDVSAINAERNDISVKVESKDVSVRVEDVSNQALKTQLEKYFNEDDEEALPDVMEAIFARKLTGKHDVTDDELADELALQPVDGVADEDFESDFEEFHDTDEDIPNLYNAAEIVKQRFTEDPYFNIDDKKWDDIVKDAIENGIMKDTKECEAILEDMLKWDSLLPDDMKRKVEAKFNLLGDKCEKNELQPEDAYKLFKEFEDEIVNEYLDKKEAEGPPQITEGVEQCKEVHPPGEGPILRWQTRAVFAPGDDAWHPKNRKVKLSVTVKELGFSKYQFRRMREIVGKRYHPGKDELTITSERFEEREENRKDCLRTLLGIIEEAGKANKIVEEVRTLYVKERLKANPAFMARLHAKSKGSGVKTPAST